MRNAFLKKLSAAAEADEKLILLTGDLGFNLFEPFARKYPHQFVNVGIAEQSMAGIAAGLALNGHHVFIYSIGNFPTLRCLEQLRNDICYHKLPVVIVTNGGGLAYGYLGMSHHATEDLSILRSLPGMTVTAPADPLEVEACFDYLYNSAGPGYLRLCRGGEKNLHDHLPVITAPVLLPVANHERARVCIVMTGEISSCFSSLTQSLEADGIYADVFTCPVLKPQADFLSLLNKKYDLIVSVEENNVIGGLGSAVAETLSGTTSHPQLLRIGMPDTYSSVVGRHDFLKEQYELSKDKIFTKIKEKSGTNTQE